METRFLVINSGHVRHAPHDGVICTNIKIAVRLTDDPPVVYNGKELVTILDSFDRKHLVDPYFLEDPQEEKKKLLHKEKVQRDEIIGAAMQHFGNKTVYFTEARKWLIEHCQNLSNDIDEDTRVDLANRICLMRR